MKIAVLRANALGDFIFVLPALSLLRQSFPTAEIVYLGRPWHKVFLSNRPAPIDRVVIIPVSFGVRDEPGEVENRQEQDNFFLKMQQEEFDIAIQLHGGGKYSNPFLTKFRAKKTVGLKSPDAEPLDIWVPYVYYQNEYQRYLEVVSLLNPQMKDISPHISVTAQDLEEVERVIGKVHDYVVIHPGASDIRRRWSPKNFSQVAEYLIKKGEMVVINGVIEEKDITQEVIDNIKGKVIDLTGRLNILGLVGLLSKAKLVISNDTGPLHLAGALNIPSVGLFWCGNLINAGLPTRSLNRPLLSWVVNCPMCQRLCTKISPFEPKFEDCQHEISFLDGIYVEEVEQAANELLSYSTMTEKTIFKN